MRRDALPLLRPETRKRWLEIGDRKRDAIFFITRLKTVWRLLDLYLFLE